MASDPGCRFVPPVDRKGLARRREGAKEEERKGISHKDTKTQRGRCEAQSRRRSLTFRFICRTSSGHQMTKVDGVTSLAARSPNLCAFVSLCEIISSFFASSRLRASPLYPTTRAVTSSAEKIRITGGWGERARISATKAPDAGTAKWARTAAISAHSSTKTRRSGFSTSTWQLCARHPASPRERALCSAPIAIMRSRCSGVRMTWPVMRIISEC